MELLDGSWGYQIIVTLLREQFGTPSDFMYLIDYLHQHGSASSWIGFRAFSEDEAGPVISTASSL